MSLSNCLCTFKNIFLISVILSSYISSTSKSASFGPEEDVLKVELHFINDMRHFGNLSGRQLKQLLHCDCC